MSSFMCSDETLISIAGYLSNYHSYVCEKKFGGSDPLLLYKELFKHNQYALVERYGVEKAAEMCGAELDYIPNEHELNRPITAEPGFPLYARLRCYLYQCEEGNIPGTDLWQMLERITNQMAVDLLENFMRDSGFIWQDYAF